MRYLDVDKDGEGMEYQPVSKLGTAYAKILLDISKALGDPDDLTTTVGWKLLDEVILVWEKAFPREVKDWKHDRALDMMAERTMREHSKAGGWNPITYPPSLYHMMKVMLPKARLADKVTYTNLGNRYPHLFKTTNYNV
jgi:hypothetical protein